MFKNIVYTTISGARSLELDVTDRLETFELSVEYKQDDKVDSARLLEFNMDKVKAKRIVDQNRDYVAKSLRLIYYYRREAFTDLANIIKNELYNRAGMDKKFRAELSERGGRDQHGKETKGRIRIFLAAWTDGVECLKIVSTFNFANSDVDDRLYLPPEASLAGLSHKHQRPILASRIHLEGAFSGTANRYRRAVKWRELQWCWTVPFEIIVFGSVPQKKQFVLAVESNIPLIGFGDDLAEAADRARDTWQDLLMGERPRSEERSDELIFNISRRWKQLAAKLLSEKELIIS